MKLKYFYKLDQDYKPIPGSNIRRKVKPGLQWKEIGLPCCTSSSVPCTCGPRYFIQIDGQGRPVDGSLTKRTKYPDTDSHLKWTEVAWISPCCEVSPSFTLSWDFFSPYSGSMTITVDSIEILNQTIIGEGTLTLPQIGDEITVSVDATDPLVSNILSISIDGEPIFYGHNIASEGPTIHTFIYEGGDIDVYGRLAVRPV